MAGVDAGRALCRLLADPALPYRLVWESRGAAYRDRQLNQTSIAKVLAAYLVDLGLLAEFEEGEWPRSRRDWVRSRLAGSVLTHLELELFLDAFGVDEQERDRLRHLLDTETPMFVPGDLLLHGLPDRNTYAVDRVSDEHVVGPAGLPAYHRTSQTLRALVDGVDAYLYIVDSGAVTVEVSKGGTAGAPRQVDEDLWAVVITLDRTLRAEETCELTFDTAFAFREPQPPVLRRAATPHGTEIAMTVSFDPGRLPAAVHLSTWSTISDPEPMTCTGVSLDHTHSAGATWTVVRAGLVGFSWVW